MPRIVSLIASATEIVCALGFEGDLVARSHECDFPPSVKRLPSVTAPKFDVATSSLAIDQQVRSLMGQGLSVYHVDAERLEAFSPLADGVAVAVEFGSDVLIRRGVRLGGEQDDAATEDECLRGGTGADEVFEVVTHLGSQLDRRSEGTWHGNPPGEQHMVISCRIIMATNAPCG